jgi:hypothetical protein
MGSVIPGKGNEVPNMKLKLEVKKSAYLNVISKDKFTITDAAKNHFETFLPRYLSMSKPIPKSRILVNKSSIIQIGSPHA